jgi:hypothetical protein
MADLTDKKLAAGMPEVLERLFARIREELKGLPE